LGPWISAAIGAAKSARPLALQIADRRFGTERFFNEVNFGWMRMSSSS